MRKDENEREDVDTGMILAQAFRVPVRHSSAIIIYFLNLKSCCLELPRGLDRAGDGETRLRTMQELDSL